MLVENREYILKIIQKYQKKYPEENILPEFKDLLAQVTSPISRKNFFGHITASAIVFDRSLKKIALIYHKILDLFLQPGGHVDDSDISFSLAAAREFAEETGLQDLLLVDVGGDDLPVHIDIHQIPENKDKQELKHRHFDLQYLFLLNNKQVAKINKAEINHFQWSKIKDIDIISPSLSKTVGKALSFFAERAENTTKLSKNDDKND